MSEIEDNQESKMSAAERRQWIIKKNLNKLEKMGEAEELSRTNYGFEELAYLGSEPLTKKEVGKRAVVVTQAELEELGGIVFINAIGEVDIADPDVTGYDENDVLVIFPDELGDLKE